MNQKQTPNYTFALIIVIAVCFLIGFVTTMNNSMIEFCKTAFDLSDAQGQLVNTAFYGAYALSIPFGFMMSKIGFKIGRDGCPVDDEADTYYGQAEDEGLLVANLAHHESEGD